MNLKILHIYEIRDKWIVRKMFINSHDFITNFVNNSVTKLIVNLLLAIKIITFKNIQQYKLKQILVFLVNKRRNFVLEKNVQ